MSDAPTAAAGLPRREKTRAKAFDGICKLYRSVIAKQKEFSWTLTGTGSYAGGTTQSWGKDHRSEENV
jgi:hypothetical protein